MADEVVKMLADKLGVNELQAHEFACVLAGQILNQVNPSNPVHVPGLGTFALPGDKLEFTPNTELARAVAGPYHQLDACNVAHGKGRSGSRTRALAWGSATAGILALVAAAWIFFSTTPENPAPPQSAAGGLIEDLEEASRLPGGNEGPDAAILVAEASGTNAEDDSTSPEPAESAPLEAGTEGDGPEPGCQLVRESGGYTLIVASFETIEAAQTEAQRFRARIDGQCVGVIADPDAERFRVAVGQVPNVPAALALRDSIGTLPEGTWVTRI